MGTLVDEGVNNKKCLFRIPAFLLHHRFGGEPFILGKLLIR
jgi:hypothetical protein